MYIGVSAFELEVVFLTPNCVGKIVGGDLRDLRLHQVVGDKEGVGVKGADLLDVVLITIDGSQAVEGTAPVLLPDGDAGAVGIIAVVSHPVILDPALQIGVVDVRGAVIVAAHEGRALVHLHGETGRIITFLGEDDPGTVSRTGRNDQRCQHNQAKHQA